MLDKFAIIVNRLLEKCPAAEIETLGKTSIKISDPIETYIIGFTHKRTIEISYYIKGIPYAMSPASKKWTFKDEENQNLILEKIISESEKLYKSAMH